jgi:hypothetical protein
MVRAGWSGDFGSVLEGPHLVYRFGSLSSSSQYLSLHIRSFHSTILRYRDTTDPRLIPDGAITAAHFIKTPYYVQIHGFWDGTSMNIVRLFPLTMCPC